MRLIDADALEKEGWILQRRVSNRNEMATTITEGMSISLVPTVDAVPVVRCKDCTYRDSILCTLYNLNEDYDYCSLGEGKDDE